MENKIIQSLGIPFTALISIIFLLMIISFPIGAYVIFNSGINDNITYEYPMDNLESILDEIGIGSSMKFELGDGFIILWSIYLILFTIAILGPKKHFIQVLQSIVSHGKYEIKDNYMFPIIKWFSILVLASTIIIFAQEFFGISTEQLGTSNDLIQFFDLTLAPLVEEFLFRGILIGIPIFLLYSNRFSFKFFIKSLWRPWQNLEIVEKRKGLFVIVVVGIVFGASHIIFSEGWSAGKFAQASIGGIIIGWVYFRYGFAPAIIIHWATNYFIFSYGYLVADLNHFTIQNAFTHPFVSMIEILLITTGIISMVILVVNYITEKRCIMEKK